MALDWTDRSLAAAQLDPTEFLARSAQEIARIAEGHPELPRAQALAQLIDLHRRHGQTVETALAAVIAGASGTIAANKLETTSLLRMLLADRTSLPEQPQPRPPRPVIALGSETIRAGGSLFPLQVTFDRDAKGTIVDVLDLTTLRGVLADLVHCLKEPFDLDRAAGRRIEDYEYSRAGFVHPRGKDAAKRCVNRVRQILEEAVAAIYGEIPERELLIEAERGRGYRLDPTINLVVPESASEKLG